MAMTRRLRTVHPPGGELLWESERHVAWFASPMRPAESFPGSCRVILKRHVAEMSDLDAGDARRTDGCRAGHRTRLRKALQPDKINLASLGNMVPHLHWHVVPRWRDDSHFPAPIWATAQRDAPPHPIASLDMPAAGPRRRTLDRDRMP
jgi:diadenosine tetraphosphate (Ap4A) HIT family hydrolase